MLTDFLLLWILTVVDATPITVDVHHRSLSRRGSTPATAHSNIPSDINSTTSTPIILTSLSSSSDAPSLQLPSLPVDWMHQNLATLGCHPLRHLALPGTHDSGMSTLTHSTFLSTPENTLTHFVPILDQLRLGIRYFDIRPVISGGAFTTGHYSKIGSSWIGGNGQSLDSIVSDINTFLATNKELVILDLSHMMNTDDNYRDLNADELARLLTHLENLQHRYTGPIEPNNDLTTIPLKTFIATSPAVLIINSATNIPLPPSPPAGVFPYTSWNLYNSYANTPLSQLMAADQLDKLAAQRTSLDSPPFLLSWTITTPLDIRDDAAQANELLFDSGDEGLWKSVYNSKVGPNVVLVDGIGNSNRGDVLAGGSVLKGLCMAIMSVVLEGRSCRA